MSNSPEGKISEREDMEQLFLVLLKRQQMQEMVRALRAEFSCPVCQNLLCLATLSNCGHMYCHKCIRTWCIDYERRNCPVCRVRIVARVRAPPVDRFIRRCLEEAGESQLLEELAAAADKDAEAKLFECDRAPVKSTAATFYFSRTLAASSASSSSSAASSDQGPPPGGRQQLLLPSAMSVSVRSTTATSVSSGGSLIGSFGVSSD